MGGMCRFWLAFRGLQPTRPLPGQAAHSLKSYVSFWRIHPDSPRYVLSGDASQVRCNAERASRRSPTAGHARASRPLGDCTLPNASDASLETTLRCASSRHVHLEACQISLHRVGDVEVEIRPPGGPPVNRPLRWQHRRATIALPPRTVQNIPERLRREPITVVQPASVTPEPTTRC